jgi:hypothetical protein
VTPTVTPKPTAKPADSDFTTLAQLKSSATRQNTLTLSWTKADGAKGYDIFFASAGSKNMKLYRSVGAGTTKLTITGLKPHMTYKACVKAWKRVNGAGRYFGEPSPVVFAITGGSDNTHCDAEYVRLSRSKLTLKAGNEYEVGATLKGMSPGKDLLALTDSLRFYSTSPSVATVSGSGRIKAVNKGSCTIYVLANNGVRASMKVTVR